MARRVRSLHVSDMGEGGGAEAVFADVVEAAKALGHEVSILVSDGRRTPFSYVFSTRWYCRMRDQLRTADPDIVHLHNYYHFLSPSILLAIRHHRRQRRRPQVVLTAHDYHLICPNSVFQHFPRGTATTFDRTDPAIPIIARFDQRGLVHSLLKAVTHVLAYRILGLRSEIDVVVSPSEHLRDTFARAGVTAETATRAAPANKRSGSSIALVSLGRVETGKGLEELIDSLEVVAAEPDMPSIRLDIFGTGDAAWELGRRADALHHLKVRLMGHIPREKVPHVLQRYDGLVFPSIWPENAPITVIEAASAGVPVLVSHEHGAAEMARLTSQWLELDPDDARSVGAAIRGLGRLTGRNRLLAPEAFTIHTFRERLNDLYERLIARESTTYSS